MLIKTARFNQLRQDHSALQKDYAHLEETVHEKDVQAASLGSLASEVSALYGLTASKLAAPMGKMGRRAKSAGVAESVATAPLAGTDDGYYKSVDTFYDLRNSAMNNSVSRVLPGLSHTGYSDANPFGGLSGAIVDAAYVPTLWPVMGPITSSFGEREDPILGN